MICQACGRDAPTKHVAFYQNIGALFMRFSRTVDGRICKSCVHRTFWKFTLTNLLFGWWGVISFFVTIFYLLNNTVQYLLCLDLGPVPPGATAPQLTDQIVQQLGPFTNKLLTQLNNGEDFERVAEDIALESGVTSGQVALYISRLDRGGGGRTTHAAIQA